MIVTTPIARGLAPPPRGRRGALLLLVLGMLTLFMMIGTLMMVLALRARSTARAFADAVAGAGNRAAAARGLLDEALMTLIRGAAPSQPAAGAAPAATRESLLADRYGPTTLAGKLTGITANGPALQATVTDINVANPLDLAGRILSIKPQATDPAPVTSFRILSVNGQTFELANLRTVAVRQLPTTFPCDVFVNGREFTGAADNESWDGFDPANLFLTQASSQGATVTVGRPAYPLAAGAAAALEVDNDGDGVADGIWIDDLLPMLPDGSTARVSYLVLDLSGRLNVNAHGSLAGAAGSGPAAVDGSSLFTDPAIWSRLLSGWSSPTTPTPTAPGNRRTAPAIGGALEGRFGAGPTDTYALRLDFDGPRPVSRTAVRGNVFTCGELEWVLRPYDADAVTLPPRLAALLADSAEPARLLVTTDSWDTCGMTGAVARAVMTNGDPAGLPRESREGLRFNLDRPLGNQADKQRFFEDFCAVVVAAGAPAAEAAQWCANVIEFIDMEDPPTPPEPFVVPASMGGGTVSGVEPATLPPELRNGLPVMDPGLFESPAELLAVPAGTKAEIEEALEADPPRPIISLAVKHPGILDAVTVASPFRTTVFAAGGARTLCRWREPGRINVNTCADQVWKVLTGSNIQNPFNAGPPAKALSEILFGVPQVFSGVGKDVRGLNRGLANRLANIATTRSDVFAVWITLELTPAEANAAPAYHRLFAIVDRSIPVGHGAGQDLNARDTIRVLRHIQ
jgi:hypothetical protein